MSLSPPSGHNGLALLVICEGAKFSFIYCFIKIYLFVFLINYKIVVITEKFVSIVFFFL